MSSIRFHFTDGTSGPIILRSKDLILPLQHVHTGNTQMGVVVSLLDFVGQYDATLRMVSQKGGGIEGQQIDMCDAYFFYCQSG